MIHELKKEGFFLAIISIGALSTNYASAYITNGLIQTIGHLLIIVGVIWACKVLVDYDEKWTQTN